MSYPRDGYSSYEWNCSKCLPEENIKHCYSCNECGKYTQFAWPIAVGGREYGMCPNNYCQEKYVRSMSVEHHYLDGWVGLISHKNQTLEWKSDIYFAHCNKTVNL